MVKRLAKRAVERASSALDTNAQDGRFTMVERASSALDTGAPNAQDGRFTMVERASSALDTDATNAQDGRFTSLFFAGDIGQRIIRYSFPWKPFGIDLRGKSRVLKVNYRTTRQIRSMADRLMEEKSEDADGIVQERKGTVSLLSGPDPEFRQFDTVDDEIEGVTEAEVIAGLQEIYDTERNLLYVACTRARDYLLVTSAGIPSELLLDIYSENRNCNF